MHNTINTAAAAISPRFFFMSSSFLIFFCFPLKIITVCLCFVKSYPLRKKKLRDLISDKLVHCVKKCLNVFKWCHRRISHPLAITKFLYFPHLSNNSSVSFLIFSGVPFLNVPAGSIFPITTASSGITFKVSSMSMAFPNYRRLYRFL